MNVFDLDELKFSSTASLFEGLPRAGVGISVFVVRTPPGKGVELHVHPYSETFVLLEGSGRWTAGDEAVDLHTWRNLRANASGWPAYPNSPPRKPPWRSAARCRTWSS